MSKNAELKIRLNEQLRIYRGSPAVQLTYVDAARIVEDLMEVMDSHEKMGFRKEGA